MSPKPSLARSSINRRPASRVHTNDAISAIPRLLDLGIPDYLVAATLGVWSRGGWFGAFARTVVKSYESSPEGCPRRDRPARVAH
jgi:hypothetical protein